MRRSRSLSVALVVASTGLLLAARAPSALPQPLLLVVNQGDHNLVLVDPRTLKAIAAVDVGGITGHEVAASPDGTTAFVPIYSNTGVGKPGTDGQTIAVIDLKTRRVTHQFDFGRGVRPHCAIYDGRRGVLYVTTELDQAVAILDPHSLKVLGTVPTTQAQSHMLALSPDGHRGYTANVGPGTVSVLDMDAHKTLKVIPVSANTQRISVSTDGSMVFTADQTAPRLAVIDPKTNTLRTWIALPAIGYGTTVTPDGRSLLVALRTSHQVAVVDLSSLKVTRTIPVPGNPTEILVSPDGQTAYISAATAVSTLNLSTWHIDQSANLGADSDGLAWAP